MLMPGRTATAAKLCTPPASSSMCLVEKRRYSIQPERVPKPGQGVYTCGTGRNAQLGVGDLEDYQLPVPVQELPVGASYIDAAAGWTQNFLLTTRHELYYWGSSGVYALLPMRRDKRIYYPTLCEPAQSLGIVKIRTGRQHGIALSKNGEVYIWGNSEFGQTGLGNKEAQHLPIRMEFFRDKSIVDVSCGLDHSAAVSKDGRVWTWGYGIDGQLGHNGTEDELKPKELTVIRGEGISRVTCGTDFTGLLNETEGRLFTFGNGEAGQLGHGERGLCLEPSVVPLDNVKEVAAGGAHMLALTKDGQAWSWGWGEDGRLGHGATEDFLKPEPIPTLGPAVGVVSVSAGGGHSLALTESGQVYGWGFNASGRLGLGNESSVMTPTLIKALADKRVLRAICGLDHSLFITQA